MSRIETIGEATLYLGDCLDILPTLGKVDAVDCGHAVVYNNGHEKSAIWQPETPTRSGGNLDEPQVGDRAPIRQRDMVAGSTSGALRCLSTGHGASVDQDGDTDEIARSSGSTEWAIQGRDTEHDLPEDGGKERLREVRDAGESLHSPQGRVSHEQPPVESAGSLHGMPHQPPQSRMVAKQKGWALLTDPPYGIGMDGGRIGKANYEKLDWDQSTAERPIAIARQLSEWQVVFGGNYYELPPSGHWLIWDKQNDPTTFADFEMAWTNLGKSSRMVRHLWSGPYMKVKEERWHPTQKPVAVMQWCIEQLPADAQTILDPFMGSGTTGVACANLGRKFIGIELEPKYFDIACRRIDAAYKQPRLFQEPAPKSVQEVML